MANAKAISVSRPCKEINHASNSSHFVAIFKRFHDMKSNMELCDVALKAENVTFSAHRLVLAANSPYLKNIFLSENEEARCQEIILPKDVRCETVKLMLEYFYTGKLQVNSEDCEDMLAMACLLKVRESTGLLVSQIVTAFQFSMNFLCFSNFVSLLCRTAQDNAKERVCFAALFSFFSSVEYCFERNKFNSICCVHEIGFYYILILHCNEVTAVNTYVVAELPTCR